MSTPSAPGLQDLVDTVADLTGAPTTLEDRDLHLVAASGHDDVVDEVRRSSILRRRSDAAVQEAFAAFGIARARGPLRVPADPAAGRLARWCVPVRWRGVTYGYLWLLDPGGHVEEHRLAQLHDVVDAVAATLATRSRTADRTAWAVGELLSPDAAARGRATEELAREAVLPAGELRVVALAPTGGEAAGPVNAWLLPRAVVVAPVGSRAALLVPGALPAADVAARAAGALLAQHPAGVAAGVSGPVTAAGAHTGWRQAQAALRAALTALPHGAAAVRGWEELGTLRLLALAEAGDLAAVAVDERARRLLAGDPELVRTARTYLDLAGSAQRTAAALAVHRQTLYHRLRRVREVSGYDLDDGADRLALHLALTLADLARPA
ncbi:helix-turn-helix domain-containing protein [Paenibacillus sp. TRM 82003]|uniref:PucR family transcriptional regulator n=1 Tax=Kineococcus sp. TRM81007 TaxID=2925831 RepID=UPI001F61C521|nr:helix-turn-helix domain-containing protein [Kineococcus sp. TRM81007]MCI3926656.1 helix-turn-helix domain-containing protein [Paenibacillus sp. TRM 82003]